jgi:radical SAM superfamily enzyme YgiQ (UPF0313 family)
MQRILVIAANQERMPDPIPPLGAGYIAAAVRRRGHVTKIFDACFSEDYQADLAASLEAFRPDIIGLSIRNVDSVAFPNATCYLERYAKIVRVCRERAAQATLFVGGSAFSLFPEEFVKELDVDYGIVGEGENAFCLMVDELDRHGRIVGDYADERGIVHPVRITDLDANVAPALDLLDIERYFAEGGSINVQTKRGCPYKCIYCTYPLLEGHQVRLREPGLVVDELQRAKGEHGVDFFFFVDNVFNYPARHAAAICEELLRRDLRIRWTAYVSPAGLTRELLDLMGQSGCQSIDLGTDSISNPQLERLGKSFDVAQVVRVSDWCHELGLKFSHSLIFGGPGETWDTLRETVDNAVRTRANAVIAMLGVRLYRDTKMARYAIEQGLTTREQIGIAPVFFVAEAIREGLVEYFSEVSDRYRNWILPGLGKNLSERLFKRVRAQGVKGPLWELLDSAEYRGAPEAPGAAQRLSP